MCHNVKQFEDTETPVNGEWTSDLRFFSCVFRLVCDWKWDESDADDSENQQNLALPAGGERQLKEGYERSGLEVEGRLYCVPTWYKLGTWWILWKGVY